VKIYKDKCRARGGKVKVYYGGSGHQPLCGLTQLAPACSSYFLVHSIRPSAKNETSTVTLASLPRGWFLRA